MKPPRGYFMHIAKTKQNCLALDLLITHNDGRWLEVELKAKGGRCTPWQKAYLEMDKKNTALCWNEEEFLKVVEAFIAGGRK